MLLLDKNCSELFLISYFSGVFEKELTKDMLENPSNNSNLAGGSLVSSDLMTTSNDQTLMGNYSYKPSTTDPDIETFVHSFLERNYGKELHYEHLRFDMISFYTR